MKKSIINVLMVLFVLGLCGTSSAHFGMVIPSDSMIMQDDPKTINLKLSFSHPMEVIGMDLVKPKIFRVLCNGKTHDLLSRLKETKVMGHAAWQADYRVKRPGVCVFHMEPKPYWEPAEDCFIIHYRPHQNLESR